MQAFTFLDPAQRLVVEPLLESVNLDSGEELYTIGGNAACAFVVVSGTLAVRQLNGFGQQGQAVALLSAGAPVGEAALVGNNTRSSTLTAVEDSRLLRLSSENFNSLKRTHPDIAVLLLEFFLSKASLRLQRCSARLSQIL